MYSLEIMYAIYKLAVRRLSYVVVEKESYYYNMVNTNNKLHLSIQQQRREQLNRLI